MRCRCTGRRRCLGASAASSRATRPRAAEGRSCGGAKRGGAAPPIRLFTYAASRSAETARQLYDGARGALLTDGYEAYESVAKARALVHLGCWAHARRRFVEAEAALPKAARTTPH